MSCPDGNFKFTPPKCSDAPGLIHCEKIRFYSDGSVKQKQGRSWVSMGRVVEHKKGKGFDTLIIETDSGQKLEAHSEPVNFNIDI